MLFPSMQALHFTTLMGATHIIVIVDLLTIYIYFFFFLAGGSRVPWEGTICIYLYRDTNGTNSDTQICSLCNNRCIDNSSVSFVVRSDVGNFVTF